MNATCARYGEDLTAFLDGELGIAASASLRRHLRGCTACTAELERLRAAVRQHETVLAAPVAVDVERLLASARESLNALGAASGAAATPPSSRQRWSFFPWNRALVAGATAAALVLASWFGLRDTAPTVLVPLGLEEPPAAVAKKPDFYREYSLIRELDALEHFEAVNRVRLEKSKPRPTRARET